MTILGQLMADWGMDGWMACVAESLMELCLVMEYCPHGDLDQKIRRYNRKRKCIDEREIWVYCINILEGLATLHAKGVVHRG